MNLKHIFKKVTMGEERDYERNNVEQKRARYLEVNPLDRYRDDSFYRLKVDRIREGLSRRNGHIPTGLILDIGGNTAGEASVLQQEGASFVIGDVNEVALEISKLRLQRFGLNEPGYCVLDVHNLPFADNSFDSITVIEALHHFPNYERALGEIFRVLQPGGQFISIEPNGLSPLRRLSEIRDRLRGTIEKSFFREQLFNLLRGGGFTKIDIEPLPTGKSSWKLEEVPKYRRWLARLHGWLGENYPKYFGSFMIYAIKPGDRESDNREMKVWTDLLREPGGKGKICFDRTRCVWMVEGSLRHYPEHKGIPMMMYDDRIE